MTRQTNFDPRWGRRGEDFLVVADGGRARILRRDGPLGGPGAPRLHVVQEFERPSAHQPARELTTDLTGRVNTTGSRVGFGPRNAMRHGAQSDYDPHAIEVQRFARELAARLLQLSQERHMEKLVLIAEPRFLGVLRRELPAPLTQLVSREVPRDLTGASDAAIAAAAFA